MGRDAPFLTPKAVAKRLKAKGLGRQWLYCQMCRKQCRDQNGFKCHCESEQHIRNMEIFAEKGEQLIEEYSKKFEAKFMEYMRTCYRNELVPPNVVYNQVIRERNHVRMNGTRWAELSEFVEHLGKSGKCKIEQTDKGIKLRYLEENDTDSKILFKQGMKRKRISGEASDVDRHEKELLLQIERAKQRVDEEKHQNSNSSDEDDEVDESDVDEEDQADQPDETGQKTSDQQQQPEVKVAFSLTKKKNTSNLLPPLPSLTRGSDQEEDGWLCEGIVVKVVSKKAGNGKFYKRKGVVKRVVDGKRGEIEMLDSTETAKVDEAELETVIPQIGRTVRVVNGEYKGCDAKLVSCDTDKYSVSVQIHQDGRIVQLPYEDVCKTSSFD